MMPLSTMTTPVPTSFPVPFFAPSSSFHPRTSTTEGRMAAYAFAARDGRDLVASVCSTAWSMSCWVMRRGRGVRTPVTVTAIRTSRPLPAARRSPCRRESRRQGAPGVRATGESGGAAGSAALDSVAPSAARPPGAGGPAGIGQRALL
jgi:hypothetical protein